MDGNTFFRLLDEAIAPVIVTDKKAPGGPIVLTLSDGRSIKVSRNRVKGCTDETALRAYIAELVN